eukprot:TRINITY_DN39882_c0_g1_i1.p1 TRINITY_DN39882_c0_g1~~TRINITY_DN39882_c0_g1_i1.p1  ORF type:complete len:400 (-),score=75.77 TRINITY_DN39882_c0_g1_i1:37-1077(-)
MVDLVLVNVESLAGNLLGTVKHVPATTTGKQMKLLLGFLEESALCPTLLVNGSFLEDDISFSQLQAETEVSLTLVFSVDWVSWRPYELIRELRMVGLFATEAAEAALSPAMPLTAREWGVLHLQRLGQSGSLEIPKREKTMNALTKMLQNDTAHWLRHNAVEAVRDLGLASSCMNILASAASSDSNRAVRRLCVIVLGELGETALPVSAEIAFLLMADNSEEVRSVAAEALAQIGLGVLPDDAMALVEASIADSNEEVRRKCSRALEHLMRHALEAQDDERIFSFVHGVKQYAESLPEANHRSSVELATSTLALASESLLPTTSETVEKALSLLAAKADTSAEAGR